MIDKDKLKSILQDNQNIVKGYDIVPRDIPSDDYHQTVFIGVRRAGKSFMLYQKMQEMLKNGIDWSNMLYLNFEEDRMFGFKLKDFDKVLECHQEMYGKRPMLFLDEIQNVDNWELFARRMADSKYNIWITGSNQKMLSKDIEATLGGRFITKEVYPYSFFEFLRANNIPVDGKSMHGMENKANILKQWQEYLTWGGMPKIATLPMGNPMKRKELSETYGKIYLNDIANRTGIPSTNFNLLRLLLKKMAESLNQPVSYANFQHNLSSVSGKIAPQTVSKYIEGSEDSWLILRLRNLTASFAEKETSCKYYFIDNGLLNLQAIDEKGKLLENAVALELFRRYGHDAKDERIFFFRKDEEVDFYIPEDNLAIQVSYTIYNDEGTYKREVEALSKFSNYKPDCKRLIITNDESETIKDNKGLIEVVPLWKWSLEYEIKNKNLQEQPLIRVNIEPIVAVAVRLTNSLQPESILTEKEKQKIVEFFSVFDTKEQRMKILDEIWKSAEKNPQTNRNGSWLGDAKEYLKDLVDNGGNNLQQVVHGKKI